MRTEYQPKTRQQVRRRRNGRRRRRKKKKKKRKKKKKKKKWKRRRKKEKKGIGYYYIAKVDASRLQKYEVGISWYLHQYSSISLNLSGMAFCI